MEVSIIIPVLNEATNVGLIAKEIDEYCKHHYEIIFVDDGSTDDTFLNIQALSEVYNHIKCLSFSRNFGHQNAIMAGLSEASGQNIIIMDGDLQHPPALIPELLYKLGEGYDVVNTKRLSTENVGILKSASSSLFYFFINKISETKIEAGVSDFKAFNKKVLHSILEFKEKELFLRGIFSWIGYKQITIPFRAPERKHGKTKFGGGKMFALALKGIISFSFKPLRVAIIAGSMVSAAAFGFAVFALISYFSGTTVAGWASTIIAVMLLGGTQLLAIGLMGEYIASLFTELKKRPLYLIDKKINLP